MRTGGYNKKPTATLKLEGNYRKDRHGDREDERICGEKPHKPTSLKGEAAKEWKRIVGATPAGVYGEQDLALLIQWCRAWQRWTELWAAEEFDKAMNVTDKMCKLASKLGLGPIERTRLRIDKDAAPKDDFEQWEREA